VNTAWERKIELARAKRSARARQFAAQPGVPGRTGEHLVAVDAEPGRDITGAGERWMRAEQLRAVERARAARSVECPCRAERGVPCGPAGDHLARYHRAEQHGAITREALKEVIAGLDVITPHVTIQPAGEQATRAAGAMDPTLRARIDPAMSGNQIDACAESTVAARLGHAAATSGASDHDRDEAARDAREEPELETGA
jgi:hypothetical protein